MLHKVTLLFLMIAFSANSSDPTCNETPSLNIIETEDFSPVLRQALKVSHWAASTKDIRTSECREKTPSLKEITQMNQNYYGSGDQSAVIGGVSFSGESAESLLTFTDLITNRGLFGDDVDTQNVSKIVPKACNKVACATEAVFGKELGQKLLYLKQFGFNASEIAHDSSSRFRKDEIDTVINSVRAFPKGLLPLDKNKQITKFKRGHTLKAHGDKTLAFARISFYDLWSDGNYSKEQMESTSFHEIAHYISSELDLDDSPEWMAISGWVDHGDFKYTSARKDNFCSHYAKDSPGEDFAESLVAYRYNPELLQAASMEKYNFIKENVFAGVEYTSKEACANKRVFSTLTQTDIENISSDIQKTLLSDPEAMMDDLLRKCDQETYQLFLKEPNAQATFDLCIEAQAKKQFVGDQTFDTIINNLSPSPRNPQMVKRLLERTIENFFIEQEFDDSLIDDARTEVHKRFSSAIYKAGLDPDAIINLVSLKNNEKACKSTWDDFSYQNINIFEAREGEKMSTAHVRQRVSLNEHMREFCMEVGRRGGRMTREDISERLRYIINPDNQ